MAQGLNIPLSGDFHYNGHILLEKYPECAATLAKYRINPGNVGYGDKHEYNFGTMIRAAVNHGKPVRLGVNWGSLDQDLLTEFMDLNSKQKLKPKYIDKLEQVIPSAQLEAPELDFKQVIYVAMLESALRSIEQALEHGLREDQMIVSTKMSELPDLLNMYRLVAKSCNLPLHLGLTEAGTAVKGMIASSAAMGILMSEGIADTIRMSLTPMAPNSPINPLEDRALEVRASQDLLQAMELDFFKPQVTSCPGCGRTSSTYFMQLVDEVNQHIQDEINAWKGQYPWC